MPVPFNLPPWLTPPDPVATYQRGIALGSEIGAQQTRTRLAEMQIARQQQEQAQAQANWEQQMALKAADSARRVQAQLRFKSAIDAGVDPMKAMMQNPEIAGDNLSALAQMYRAAQMQKDEYNFVPEIKDIDGFKFARTGKASWSVIPGEPKIVQLPDGTKAVRSANGSLHILKPQNPPLTQMERARLEDIASRMRSNLLKMDDTSPDYSEAKKAIERIDAMINGTSEESDSSEVVFDYDAQTGGLKRR